MGLLFSTCPSMTENLLHNGLHKNSVGFHMPGMKKKPLNMPNMINSNLDAWHIRKSMANNFIQHGRRACELCHFLDLDLQTL